MLKAVEEKVICPQNEEELYFRGPQGISLNSLPNLSVMIGKFFIQTSDLH